MQLRDKRTNLSSYKYNKDITERIIENIDDKFIDNLILYNLKIINEKNFLKLSFDSSTHYKFICDLLLKSNLRYKILDLFFILLFCNSSNIKEFSTNKSILKKNYVLKIYLFLHEYE